MEGGERGAGDQPARARATKLSKSFKIPYRDTPGNQGAMRRSADCGRHRI